MRVRSSAPRFNPRILTLAVLASLLPVARAADASLPPMQVDARLLVVSAGLLGAPEATAEPEVHIEADSISGRNDVSLQAEGNVRLDRGPLRLEAERLAYDQLSTEVSAEGDVRLSMQNSLLQGPQAKINLDTSFGEFEQPAYRMQRETKFGPVGHQTSRTMIGRGQADRLLLEGENQYRLRNASYSTCDAPDPDWYLRVGNLKLDYDRDTGEGSNSTLYFKDVPLAWLPWIDFPLSSGRKSGLLPPNYGSTTSTGFDLTLPYYFNIAPNYDATFTPRWMSRRGAQLGSEFRYLQPNFSGQYLAEYLPNDSVTSTERSFFQVRHAQDFGSGLTGEINYSQVSDVDYFADLSSRITSTSQDHLLRQASLDYNNGSWLSSSLTVQRFQNLSGTVEYNRLPIIRARATAPEWHGFNFVLPAEFTRFSHPTDDTGQRGVIYPQLSYPLQGRGMYLTPKLGAHISRYQVSRSQTSGPSSLYRSVPVLSVDSGVAFERDISWRGQAYTQTLEPRLYYLRSAYRDQSEYPVFDTAAADFNFVQLFSDNVYSGNDRIADANQLTAALSSRLIERSTGVEWMRFALGQRYYFRDQRVTLPGETARTGRVADWLAAVSGRVSNKVWVDTALQFDPREDRAERGVVGVRYQHDFAKMLSASYRYKRDSFRDLDIAGQWPIWGGWYGVARYNRNLKDDRLSEALAGLEYKADCWVLRVVWQTLLNTKQQRNTSRFIQLEFNGFASIGSSPVELLKRSISGYDKVNEPDSGDPVFGPSY